ncbi:MAG: hypothetical protein SV062_11705 [Thermodesulfobacteriota bacterium]|nr:hypothetical protein [Thermodesulfobacteriota bacterium]
MSKETCLKWIINVPLEKGLSIYKINATISGIMVFDILKYRLWSIGYVVLQQQQA